MAHDAHALRGMALVAAAALIWSSGGLIVRFLGPIDGWTQVFWRSLWAFGFLALYLLWSRGRAAFGAIAGMGRPGLVVACCFCVASISLVVALKLTSVAHALMIMSAAPLFAAALGLIVLGERVAAATWGAIALCVFGIALMVWDALAAGTLAGDAVAALIALAYAAAIVTMRRHAEVEMLPAMALATLMAGLIAGPLAAFAPLSFQANLLLFVFGAVQLGFGLALFAAGAKTIPAVQTALLGLVETTLGPVWVWIALGERPSGLALLGGTLIVGAVAANTLLSMSRAVSARA